MSGQIPADVQEFATKLFDMARAGDTALLEYVDHGVDVDLSNQDGNTLLMLAAYNGHAALVEGLIARRADVDRVNARGQTPLAGAIFKDFRAIARLLIDAHANPHTGHPSAVATATMFGREDLLAELTGGASDGAE